MGTQAYITIDDMVKVGCTVSTTHQVHDAGMEDEWVDVNHEVTFPNGEVRTYNGLIHDKHTCWIDSKEGSRNRETHLPLLDLYGISYREF